MDPKTPTSRLAALPVAAQGALISLGVLAVLYPSFLLFIDSPMLAAAWNRELNDPSVSEWTFIPLFKVFQVELLQHGSLLWSNLRSLGLPALGNGVQAAPLFPLTLLLAWLPDHLFWNALVVCRLALLGTGAFLLARSSMGFALLPSALFLLTFADGLYLLRWLNHPYLNGLVAGLFCLYFTLESLRDRSTAWTRARRLRLLALSLCSYSLATSGFPEAAAISALLLVFVSAPFAAQRVGWPARSTALTALELVAGAALGAALAAPQIFSLAELVKSAGEGFRHASGVHQFSPAGLRPYFLEKITLLAGQQPAPPNVHTFNLIPLFLCGAGVLALLAGQRARIGWAIGALLSASFFVLKTFAFWPWLNRFVASLPILDRSWFTVYFFPLLLWGFAYLVAEGATAALAILGPPPRRWRAAPASLLALVLAAAVVALVAYACQAQRGVSYASTLTGLGAKSVQLALIFAASLVVLALAARRVPAANAWPVLLFGLALAELTVVRPPLFRSLAASKAATFSDPALEAALVKVAAEAALQPADARMMDFAARNDSRFAGAGFATPDNGASAILPVRLQQLRAALFQTDWDGLLPIVAAKFAHSFSVTGTSLFLLPGEQPFPGPAPPSLRVAGQANGARVAYDPAALPRSYLASSCSLAASSAAAGNALAQAARGAGAAVVETEAEAERALCKAIGAPLRSVHVERDTGSLVRLSPARGPALLVLSDTFYPGWRAIDSVTGDELPIRPANLAFRGVFLPEARDYLIRFEYRPRWRGISWSCSLGAALVLSAVGWSARRRKIEL